MMDFDCVQIRYANADKWTQTQTQKKELEDSGCCHIRGGGIRE